MRLQGIEFDDIKIKLFSISKLKFLIKNI